MTSHNVIEIEIRTMNTTGKVILGACAVLVTIGGAVLLANNLQTPLPAQDLVVRDTDNTPTTVSEEYVVDQGDFLAPASLITDAPVDTLTEVELEDLMFIREEEKLAHDLYRALYDLWNVPIFRNIAESEVTHMETMAALLARYEVPDPAPAEPGRFTNPDIQNLYDTWLAEGSTSLESALLVGARVEDIDIMDIAAAVERTDKHDIITVYENLLRGSRNHMRAFNRQIVSRTGANYVPEYTTLEQFEEIIARDTERGPAGGRRPSDR